MSRISAETTLDELAVLVSEALEAAGIPAVLGGGGAVALYSDHEYMSSDLDFITSARNRAIAPVLARLGFNPRGKDFHHPECRFFLEFPPGPLSFGDRYVDIAETLRVETPHGMLRIITPTQCVMDRLAWYIHGKDRQAREQAVMVARRQAIDWDAIVKWARAERIDRAVIEEVRNEASSPPPS